MRVLVVNTGSSSLKLTVLHGSDRVGDAGDADDGDAGWEVEGSAHLERWDGEHDLDQLEPVIADAGPLEAVGHRVVHGGTDLTVPTLLTDEVEDRILALAALAPLHQPRAIAGLRAVRRLTPDVPHVACFDTAFHATMPPAAATYALPAAWRARWGLRRFGFHGLSHAWAVRRAAEIASRSPDRPTTRRVVTCHLGAGASLCAARDGRSVDTTMGYTPLEGLVMATRAGSVDPGLVLWLIDQGGLAAGEVADGLDHDAGLRGLTRTSGDMRDVLAARVRGDAPAVVGFDVYLHRLRREIAAMAAALGGVDLVAFTGGVGEHAPQVRAAAIDGLGFLGLALDPDANAATTSDGDISASSATARTVVVTAREDLEIAGEVRRLLRS
jgi:acetate kinase